MMMRSVGLMAVAANRLTARTRNDNEVSHSFCVMSHVVSVQNVACWF